MSPKARRSGPKAGRPARKGAHPGPIAAKFGGSSLADAGQFRKVKEIVLSDKDRRYIVVSAPGRCSGHAQKITDLLYLCHRRASEALPFDDIFEVISGRYEGIAADLGLRLDLGRELSLIKTKAAAGASAAWIASRGEHLCGLMLAEFLGFDFIEAAEVVLFSASGRLDRESTQAALETRLKAHSRAVIPGFYGAAPSGDIHVFSRGGSDVTGALVARGARSRVYENWTDVSGLRMADPEIVPEAERIESVTYRELRELSYTGARVLHDEAVFPVREARIPVHVLNTNRPDDPGTWILPDAPPSGRHGGLSGIAGRKDFTVIAMEKALMNLERGFGRKVLDVLERHGISYEHTPTGIDSLSVVISNAELSGRLDDVLRDLRKECRPDLLETFPDMALIAVVGRGFAHRPGVAAKVFSALAAAAINVRMIDQGSSEINIILGVETADFDAATRAIYRAFVG